MPLAAESTTVDVTYDARHGYVATHPQLPAPITALSLSALRARLGRQLDIAAVNVRLKLDKSARRQRCDLAALRVPVTPAGRARQAE